MAPALDKLNMSEHWPATYASAYAGETEHQFERSSSTQAPPLELVSSSMQPGPSAWRKWLDEAVHRPLTRHDGGEVRATVRCHRRAAAVVQHDYLAEAWRDVADA